MDPVSTATVAATAAGSTANTLLMSVLTALAAAVTAVLPVLTGYVISWIKARKRHEEEESSRRTLEAAAATAVAAVEQTSSPATSKSEMKAAALEGVKAAIGPSGVKAMLKASDSNHVERRLSDHVEAALHDMRTSGSKPATVPAPGLVEPVQEIAPTLETAAAISARSKKQK